MPRDAGIADRLREDPTLTVVEVAGWQTRGSADFDPRGSVDHHTAGPASGVSPSLGVCINGRPGLSGPLCNVYIGRDLVVHVVAAGRANHAGAGGWAGLRGNRAVFGVEHENTGYPSDPWTDAERDTAARVHARLIDGRAGPDRVCEHFEWTTRKIDKHSTHGDQVRAAVAAHLRGDEMTPEDRQWIEGKLRHYNGNVVTILAAHTAKIEQKLSEAEWTTRRVTADLVEHGPDRTKLRKETVRWLDDVEAGHG